MRLSYRGVSYEQKMPASPVVLRQTEVKGSYRGNAHVIKQYEFQTAHLESPNWRTMSYLGKSYTMQPTFLLASVPSL